MPCGARRGRPGGGIVGKARRNNKGARALRERRTDAREFGLNAYAAEQWLRERLQKTKSQKGIEMANKPIVLQPGNHTAVGANLPLAKIEWHNPPAKGGVAIVRDGNGVVLATLSSAGFGKGEPAPVLFNPPLTVTAGAIIASAPGGWLQIHIQGQSGFGY